jgi:hypothetical protein
MDHGTLADRSEGRFGWHGETKPRADVSVSRRFFEQRRKQIRLLQPPRKARKIRDCRKKISILRPIVDIEGREVTRKLATIASFLYMGTATGFLLSSRRAEVEESYEIEAVRLPRIGRRTGICHPGDGSANVHAFSFR